MPPSLAAGGSATKQRPEPGRVHQRHNAFADDEEEDEVYKIVITCFEPPAVTAGPPVDSETLWWRETGCWRYISGMHVLCILLRGRCVFLQYCRDARSPGVGLCGHLLAASAVLHGSRPWMTAPGPISDHASCLHIALNTHRLQTDGDVAFCVSCITAVATVGWLSIKRLLVCLLLWC